MPYKSQAQRRYFNANRKALEAEGVDVDEWNQSSKGKKLPNRALANKPANKPAKKPATMDKAEEAIMKLAAILKQADPMPALAMQSMMPVVQKRRPLTHKEKINATAGESRWLPRIFQSEGTPITETMSSPGRGALLAGLGAGALGAGAGGLLGAQLSPDVGPAGVPLGALVGGLGVGGLAALLAYHNRKANNEGVREMMTRLPQDATLRDLESDPAHQARLNRENDLMAARSARPYAMPMVGLNDLFNRDRD